MALCDEPVRLHIHPPTGTEVREYVTARGRHPSKAQSQALGEEVVSQSPFIESHSEGGPTTIPYGPQRPQ